MPEQARGLVVAGDPTCSTPLSSPPATSAHTVPYLPAEGQTSPRASDGTLSISHSSDDQLRRPMS